VRERFGVRLRHVELLHGDGNEEAEMFVVERLELTLIEIGRGAGGDHACFVELNRTYHDPAGRVSAFWALSLLRTPC